MKNSTKIILSIVFILPIMAMALINNPNKEMSQLPVGDDLVAGKALFTSKACFACHGMNGEGMPNLGTNLTDDYSKHGCSEEDYIKVITNGVAGTTMVPYGAQLKPEEIKQLAKYIVSLKGSNPANAKAPEGDKCE